MTPSACDSELPYGPAVQVFYRFKASDVPIGCADIDLVVEYL